MSGTKVMWAQLTVVLSLVLAAIWAATQWCAWRLGFQPQLGDPLAVHAGLPLYPPYAFFWWWFAFDAYAPRVFLEGAGIISAGAAAAVIASMLMSVWRARESRNVTTYGSARWAGRREIARAGLLGDAGVVLGKVREGYLRHDGPEHVLCFAPTRSGKGVGLVVPTLLTWPDSLIVHDIKGENWSLTSACRARVGRVLKFDPTDRESAAYNPLLEVRRRALRRLRSDSTGRERSSSSSHPAPGAEAGRSQRRQTHARLHRSLLLRGGV